MEVLTGFILTFGVIYTIEVFNNLLDYIIK